MSMRILRFQKHIPPGTSAFLDKLYAEHASTVTAGTGTVGSTREFWCQLRVSLGAAV